MSGLPTAEMAILKHYCEETQRTQSDVIREFIRSLKAAAPVAQKISTLKRAS
jgi:hypothetical protein